MIHWLNTIVNVPAHVEFSDARNESDATNVGYAVPDGAQLPEVAEAESSVQRLETAVVHAEYVQRAETTAQVSQGPETRAVQTEFPEGWHVQAQPLKTHLPGNHAQLQLTHGAKGFCPRHLPLNTKLSQVSSDRREDIKIC